MADDENTMRSERRKALDLERADLEARRAEARRRHENEIARRNTACEDVARRVLANLKMKAANRGTEPPVYAREQQLQDLAASGKPFVIDHAPRAKSWKGPHHGEQFTDAALLQRATLAECHAGYRATWGHSMTDRDLEVYRIVREMPEKAVDAELQARKIYTELRRTIEAAHRFSRAYYNNAAGTGMRALDALWEHLPPLPKIETLPGYVKRRGPHGQLVATWQEMARQNLGWKLERRELAEVSILLGVSAIPYKDIIATSGKLFRRKPYATVSDVIEWESKNLDRSLGSRQKVGGRGVEESK